ncbi:MAG: ornithine cyclodeaminase family protein [Chloroflexi bacterium]|nr:ornithine cyclodeaminase family protein [Chloroflexota bacterium]
MLFIDNPTVDRVLSMDECIEAQDIAFRGLPSGASVHRPRIDVYVPTDRTDGYYRWGTMEGASKDLGVFAIRMKSDILYWPKDEHGNWKEEKYSTEEGLYCGLVFLFSTRNGEPLAMINDGIIQHMRVGGGAGLGAKYLSREDSHTVGMIGSGGMARTYLQAFCSVRDIRKVKVFSPTKKNREAYAAEMTEKLEVDVEAVDKPEYAVDGADIVAACTNAMQPALKGAWLQPGQHVTDVRGELDDEVFTRATVSFRQGVSHSRPRNEDAEHMGDGYNNGDYVAGNAEELKRLPERHISGGIGNKGDLPTFNDLAAGNFPGRRSRNDITLYLNSGNQGLQFAAVGAAVYNRAKEMGLGRELPTEWFLQDIRD